MKGLIRNNFYSMNGNLIMAFTVSAILALTPFFILEKTILAIVVSVQIFLFVSNIGTSLHADEMAKWNTFERTLPVRHYTVIGAKYISFILLLLFGFFMSVLTGIAISFISTPTYVLSLHWGYSYGLTLSTHVICIAYPAMLILGTDKNELILLLSAFTSIGLMFLLAFLLSPLTNGMNLQSTLVTAVSILLLPIMLLISYFISLKIYARKEF